jgi:heme oxygenase (biliverdin-IX-beta and delta-forming)
MDEESKEILRELFESSKIASLGTSNENQPFVSMVAFSTAQNFSEFYIHISGLAKHTKNISLNNKVSLMICQPETVSNNPQTLARVSIIGNANIVDVSDTNYNEIKTSYLSKNPSAEMYFSLGDFQLFRIEVEKVRYVAGFAKTFNLTKVSLQNLNSKDL